MLSAICAGSSQTSPCTAGGFSPGNVRNSLSHAGSHTGRYMQKRASIRHVHSHLVWVQESSHLKAVVQKTRTAQRGAWLLRLVLGTAAPANPGLPETFARARISPTMPRAWTLPCSQGCPGAH